MQFHCGAMACVARQRVMFTQGGGEGVTDIGYVVKSTFCAGTIGTTQPLEPVGALEMQESSTGKSSSPSLSHTWLYTCAYSEDWHGRER